MIYTTTLKRLYGCSLDADQRARTCGYWYTVTDTGGTPVTAFETRPLLMRWLDRNGLTPEREPPQEGTHGGFRIHGEAKRHLHMSLETMPSDGFVVPALDNGSYTLGVYNGDGLHIINCNAARPKLDYQHARQLSRDGWSAPNWTAAMAAVQLLRIAQ